MCVMTVGSKEPSTYNMEIFVTNVKKKNAVKIATNSSILDITVILDPACVYLYKLNL